MNNNTAQLQQQPARVSRVMLLALATILVVVTLGPRATFAAAAERPDQVVITATDSMLAALKSEHEAIESNPQHVFGLADRIVMPHIDVERMSSWVLGKYWRRASEEQKQRFPAQFRNLVLRTYATALAEYTDETVSYQPLRADADATDVTVKTTIERSAGPAIPVAYRMHRTDAGWKVYDITIDGISLVNNYRRSFASEIRRHGLDALINKLAARNTVASK